MKSALHQTRCWVFDLDNTLYPAACNLFVQVDRRIQQYIMDMFDAGPEEARTIQKSFFHEYGTTLNGLMTNHGVDPGGYLAYVHDIDVSPVQPNPALDAVLARLPGRKLVYTNGSVSHAERVMERLGGISKASSISSPPTTCRSPSRRRSTPSSSATRWSHRAP